MKIGETIRGSQIDRGAAALLALQDADRHIRSWPKMPNGDKRQWRGYANAVPRAPLDETDDPKFLRPPHLLAPAPPGLARGPLVRLVLDLPAGRGAEAIAPGGQAGARV